MNTRTHRPTWLRSLLGAGFAAAALALPVQAQTGGNGFTAFVGCWEPLDAGEEAGLLCFRPSGAGVEMFNVLDGEVVSSEQIVADGSPRPVSAEGCTGFESAAFSEDGLRVFTRSEFTCDDDVRAGTGVMSFIAPTQWIDVRSLEVEGEPVAWVQRYELADADALDEQGIEDPADFDRTLVRAMRARAARDIEVADIEEAVRQIEARAVEVWVATNETELELTGSDLVRLADAGVPESVIDVMVAVSYPDRFVVTPEGAAEADRMAARAGYYDPGYRRGYRSYLWGPYYRPLGLGYYGYSPFGYYGYGWGGYYGGYYGYRPATVIVQPVSPGSSGRMVPGRGYTRGSSSAGSGGAPRSSVGGPAPSSSRSGGGSVRRSGGSSDGGGSSSSGSSGSSGRRAQPRGN